MDGESLACLEQEGPARSRRRQTQGRLLSRTVYKPRTMKRNAHQDHRPSAKEQWQVKKNKPRPGRRTVSKGLRGSSPTHTTPHRGHPHSTRTHTTTTSHTTHKKGSAPTTNLLCSVLFLGPDTTTKTLNFPGALSHLALLRGDCPCTIPISTSFSPFLETLKIC